jgi:hypothetical protein
VVTCNNGDSGDSADGENSGFSFCRIAHSVAGGRVINFPALFDLVLSLVSVLFFFIIAR